MAKTDVWLRGDWMQTYSGRKFYPMDPQPEDIYLEDIAHSLSMICRYGGHIDRFYSVAEHSVLVSTMLEGDDAKWGLLHDAAEAYVGDMVRPLKRQMPDYEEAEKRVIAAVAERFGMPTPVYGPAVVDADNRILLTERATLMGGKVADDWNLGDLEPLPVTVIGFGPDLAKNLFLKRCEEIL